MRSIDAAVRLVAIALVGGSAAPLFAQEVQYVPRVEHEQLKAELEAMQFRLDSMEQQVEEPVAESELDADTVNPNLQGFKPGWERVRSEGWMEQGKLEQMNVLVGSAGPIDLYLGLNTAGRLQYLVQDDVFVPADPGFDQLPNSLEPGFQTAWGSLEMLADLYDGGLEVYFDVYLSNPSHPDAPQGHEGYMIMRRVPGMEDGLIGSVFDAVNFKAGQFEIDYGDHRYRRTDNARAQRNLLIGNYVMDPKTTEIGMEVFNAEPGTLNWLAGFGSGSETGGFSEGRGISAHGKVWANLNDALRVSGSAYYVNHDAESGARSNLYRTSRDGHTYQGIFVGNSPGQILPGSGRDVRAVQGDVSYIQEKYELYGNVGWVSDETDAGLDESWLYYSLEGAYRFTDRLYAAARYSGAMADELSGVSSEGQVHRAQIGGGYWLYSTVLIKAEYVHQLYQDFDESGGLVSGVAPWTDPSFNGVIMEVSFSF